MPFQLYGDITRELYLIWKERAEENIKLHADVISMAFHDMGVFPSKSQVHEMLHCASDCSNRSVADHITFGEFCVFSSELKSEYQTGAPRPAPLSKLPASKKSGFSSSQRSARKMAKPGMKCEVFLGGSCNPTTWRQEVAIPLLKKFGITYYNPQVPHWGPELVELENEAKQIADVLFFVVDNQTRSVASIIEAAYYSGHSQERLVLVNKRFEGAGQTICGEPITEMEYLDLSHGQAILQDLVERQGIPVFEDVGIALNCAVKMLQKGVGVQQLCLGDMAHPVKMAHIQLGDKLIKLREVFNALDVMNSGKIGLSDVQLAFRTLTNEDLTLSDVQKIVANHKDASCNGEKVDNAENLQVNFDQFCCIVTEFRHKRPDNHKLLNLFVSRTSAVLHSLASPFAKLADWLMVGPSMSLTRMPNRRYGGSVSADVRDVYLGGSYGTNTWREDFAIPMLKKNGLTYFNLQNGRWSERLIPIEAAAMENSSVLLFVICNKSRGVSSMAVASHYIGLGCNIVVCVQYLKEDCVIKGETLSSLALKDYNRGRVYFSDLANRAGVPVFDDIEESLECVIQKCKSRE